MQGSPGFQDLGKILGIGGLNIPGEGVGKLGITRNTAI